MTGRNRAAMLSGTLALLVLFTVVYAPSISYGFLGDDFLDLDHSFGPGSFTRYEAGGFRPLIVAVWSLDSTIYGCTHSWGWHLTNLLLHLINTLLIWILLGRLDFRRFPRFAGTALFLLSFAAVPSAARVSGRTTMIALLPLIASFAAYAGWIRKGGRGFPWAAASLLLISLFAKETALLSPLAFAALGIYMRGTERENVRRSARDLLLMMIPVVIYAAWRLAFVGLMVPYAGESVFGISILRNIVRLSAMVWEPWLGGVPLRLLLLAAAVFLVLPLRRETKILFLVMTAALLGTVSHLPPRNYYSYAALPAASIVLACLSSRFNRHWTVPLVLLLLAGAFLGSRDEVLRMGHASDYVENLAGQLSRIDEDEADDYPVFVHDLDLQIEGYPTVWGGELNTVLECFGHSTGRIVADEKSMWEYIFLMSDSLERPVRCRIARVSEEGCEQRVFDTSWRSWDAISEMTLPVRASEGWIHVDSATWRMNSMYMVNPPGDFLILLADPLNPSEFDSIMPVRGEGDSLFFDLEENVSWLTMDLPSTVFLAGNGTAPDRVFFSSRRIWLPRLIDRLEKKGTEAF